MKNRILPLTKFHGNLLNKTFYTSIQNSSPKGHKN